MATVIFNTDRRLIIEIDTGLNINELRWDRIYSEWKEWFQIGDNSRFPYAFVPVGGEPISEDKELGATVFLTNGWKFKPAEYTHNLILTGNVYTVPAGQSTSVSTDGLFTVLITNAVSQLVETQTADVGEIADDVADAVIDYEMTGYNKHGTFGAIQVRDAYNGVIYIDQYNDSGNATGGLLFPVGMPQNPVDNPEDLLTLLENYHISRARIVGDLDIPATSMNINGITFCSSNTIDRTLSIPVGTSTRGTKFHEIIVTGTLNGRTSFISCDLVDVYGFYGDITDSTITGMLDFDDSTGVTSVIKEGSAGGDGITPTFNIKDAKISIIDWTGWVNLAGKTGTSILGASVSSGVIEVQDTCVAGLIILAGSGSAVDNSGAGCIVSTTHLLNSPNISDAVWTHSTADSLIGDIEFIKQIESGKWAIVGTQMIFYEDDDTTEIARFNLFNSAGQPANQDVFSRVKV